MLTGTPVQNNLEELQGLLSFLLPDVFSADVIAAQWADEQACTAAPPHQRRALCVVSNVKEGQRKAGHHS